MSIISRRKIMMRGPFTYSQRWRTTYSKHQLTLLQYRKRQLKEELKVSLQQIQGPVENGLPASTSSSSVIDYFPHFPFINFCSTPPTSAEEPKPVVLKKPDTPKRKVLFNFVISVILIPTRTEFYEAGLDNDMWWCSLDFEDFKRSAVLEIREFMKGTASTALVAMKALYQPNPNMETVLETATSIDSPYYADNPNPTA